MSLISPDCMHDYQQVLVPHVKDIAVKRGHSADDISLVENEDWLDIKVGKETFAYMHNRELKDGSYKRSWAGKLELFLSIEKNYR